MSKEVGTKWKIVKVFSMVLMIPSLIIFIKLVWRSPDSKIGVPLGKGERKPTEVTFQEYLER